MPDGFKVPVRLFKPKGELRIWRENYCRSKDQQIIEDHIDLHSELYIETSQAIHANPEIGNQEFFASKTLTKLLQDAGFEVTRDIAGHETGFIAKKASSKKGPKIAFLAEYDALPGLGHACGHNIIGTTSVAKRNFTISSTRGNRRRGDCFRNTC